MAEEEKPAAEPKKSKATLFIIIGAVVFILLIGGVAGWLIFGGGDEDDHGGHGDSKSMPIHNLTEDQQALAQNEAYRNPSAIIPLEKELIVNLKSPDQTSTRGGFVKLNVSFIPSDKSMAKEIGDKQAVISQVIMDEVSKFTAADLQGQQGRITLANQIRSSLNGILVDGRIEAVVFPDFLIQP
ncbi:hypothetical protein LS73_005945 [Helicobacter muridarum]|uniref:Flagellar protein FliL n=1 Tax=Helicobacter muridarum TaxID=216 RepID=A0A099U0X9_9HELI|nr:flagellar basal body-associated FliL family protein [Helicobacter muridarum]TLE00071.1 hypothetical protein LS73_005945 [Helicobacter muridarum]STQ86081.1 putative flagellar protein FliL [Helicobacter muridarum]